MTKKKDFFKTTDKGKDRKSPKRMNHIKSSEIPLVESCLAGYTASRDGVNIPANKRTHAIEQR